MRNYSRVSAGMVLLLLSFGAAMAQDSVSKVASRVDERYNHLKSFTAHFEQIYQGAGISRAESGELFLLKPGRMRWDYQQPRSKVFLTDNKTAYLYVPGDHQARRMPVKKLQDFQSPIRLLLGHTDLQKEFRDLTLSPEKPLNPSDTVLQGIPKGMEERVSKVLMEINPLGQIIRIYIEELDGTTTDFRFSEIRENAPLKSELFKLRIPEDVQVVDEGGSGP